MRIVSQTETALILKDENPQSRRHELTGGLPILLLFALSFVSGGATSILRSEHAQLSCNRAESTQAVCHLARSSLLQQDQTPRIIRQLQSAELATQHAYDSSSYQVMLITPTEEIPLTRTFTSGAGRKQQRVNTINAFLTDSTQKSLTVQQTDHWVTYIVGGLFLFVGGGLLTMILTSEIQISCSFDQSTEQMRLEKQSLLTKTVQEIPLSQIKGADVSMMNDDDGHALPQAVQLILLSGRKISLQLSIPGDEFHSVARSINQILNVKT